jgi:hypothetical protein
MGIAAAPDEVDDLQVVALAELCTRPAVTGNNVEVQFYGDAIGFHAESFYECGEGKRSGGAVEVAHFAVDLEFHGYEITGD